MTARHFDTALGCLVSPAVEKLAAQLIFVDGLTVWEREVVAEATRASLSTVLHAKLSRLLVLELNAARVTGKLSGETPERRWTEFINQASQQSFWDDLAAHYPSLLSRSSKIVQNRCTAALRFAERWAADRGRLMALCRKEPGELQRLAFGAGDSHCQGSTVALLHGDGWQIVYKPRPLAIDVALRDFVSGFADEGQALGIRIPAAVDSGDYGWTEFVAHRYAAGEGELLGFYRGIGHCLALMRLLGGSDLHAENVIAHGSTPVVIDCETLFTPRIPPLPSRYGNALDCANELLSHTVLGVGLLPGRGVSLGWRGVDVSAVGMLPGEQPAQMQPGILRAGSDEAYVGLIPVDAPRSQNHPSPRPALAEYWPEVLHGFDELTATLRALDARHALHARLHAFEGCRVRVVPRSTETYAEIGRMLWHPVSLHNEGAARQRAFNLLKKMAANFSLAPSDPAVIDAEIDDLLEGDIPYFHTEAREGRLRGPRGTLWLEPSHLVEASLERWRKADFVLERNIIQASLVSAYINDGWRPNEVTPAPKMRNGGNLDERRRQQAAQIMARIANDAFRGDDGSIAWIAPTLSETGWSVQLLEQDLYNGISGLALLIGAYLHETKAGRATPVDGLDKVRLAALHTLHLAEAERERAASEGVKLRPPMIGGYVGLGSQIWTYLVMERWRLDGGDGLSRSRRLAEKIDATMEADRPDDLLSGTAGGIVPLLMLADRTGDERYLRTASKLGDQLLKCAIRENGTAYWPHSRWPKGIGGFAHGATGVGWALKHLARATNNPRYNQLSQEAFAFEETLWDDEEQNWLDLRMLEGAKSAAAWCHGAVGIGLAHLSLDPTLSQASTRQTVRRAADATWRRGVGWNHCTCHGDLGAWELLHFAATAGEAPEGLSATSLLDVVLTSIERQGPSCGICGNAFTPALLPGIGGIVYQLLRAHPESDLPSILTPDGTSRGG